jgi:aspartate racemase
MRIIGLVGGTGWISTVEYYRIINQETNRRRGGLRFAECVLYSLDFGVIAELKERGDDEGIFRLVLEASRKVEAAGAECILLCANTMHQHADGLEGRLSIPVVHIADATGAAIKRRGMKTVGLLGTKQTMELDFYRKRLARLGIEAMVPDEDDRRFVDGTIMDELLKGIFAPASKARFLSIMEELHGRGAEGIVLGCTEIPLLVKQSDSGLPLFDTLDIHARAAVDFALSV